VDVGGETTIGHHHSVFHAALAIFTGERASNSPNAAFAEAVLMGNDYLRENGANR
jgi:hypothetical protein